MASTPWTRRKFLAAGAGLVAGAACSGGGSKSASQSTSATTSTTVPAAGLVTPSTAARKATTDFSQFDHLVVLMFENRSFDNMLGYLYQPNQVPRNQQFDGVAGKDLFNMVNDPTTGLPQRVPVSAGTVMDNPNPDPGEEYPHINTDLFSTVLPPTNATKAVPDMQAPWNAPSPVPNPAPMSGFVQDYINEFTWYEGRAPTPAEYSIIMNCFAPESVPVISALAQGFAVADHWHCEVPSQTFCNRSFFHAATSSGYTNNEPYYKFPFYNSAKTVFDNLNAKNLPWRVYYDSQDIYSLTYLIHFRRLFEQGANFNTMDQFKADVANGNLPKYSFIEPRMLLNHNDEHPPAPLFGHFQLPSSVLAGEALLADVYNAIRNSSSTKGSNWRNTALLITFDEGGGCYDHVSPGQAPAPPPNPSGNEEGFGFDRLGERVPAVLVSAYTQAGTVVSDPLRHTSVLRTMSEKWGLPSLTVRDQTAPDMSPFFNLSKPRPVSDWPTVSPRPVSVASPADANNEPLNELQRDLIGAADAAVGPPDPGAVGNLKTVGDGVAYLQQKGKPH